MATTTKTPWYLGAVPKHQTTNAQHVVVFKNRLRPIAAISPRNPPRKLEKAQMRIAKSLPLCLIALLLTGCAITKLDVQSVDAQALVGTWKVDLRPTPTDSAYFQQFVVSAVVGKKFSGTFYGAPIQHARINSDWGNLRIAFVTNDQSGPYNHSATLVGNKLEGLSNSTGRDFLSYWSAAKN